MLESLLPHDKLSILLESLKKTKHIPGSIIEFGVYRGGSLKHIGDTAWDWGKPIIGMDTFTGLPETESPDMPKGRFNDTSIEYLKILLPNTTLIPASFPEQLDKIPVNPISFAHIDIDMGLPTYGILQFINPLVNRGGIIVLDDYDWPETPHIKPAIDMFKFMFASHYHMHVINHQAILTKL